MSDERTFDIIVIGGGPAGYVGAIRAAQLGMRVACVERDKLGGICLNWGCIPTKALLAGAEFYSKLKHDAANWGIEADNVRHNWGKVIERSRGVAGQLNKGIGALFKKNKITHVEGHAIVTAAGPPCKVDVHEITDNGPGKVTQTLTADHVVVATGARPRELPFAPYDADKVISYKQAMVLPQQPESLIVVGAGAIGMEFAYFYNAFGTKVTVIEMLDHLLPIEDEEVSRAIEKAFRKQKIAFHTSTKTTKIEKSKNGVKVTIAPVDDDKKTKTLEADKVLIAIGVQGNVEGVIDDKLGVETERGHFVVDKQSYQTNVKGIYAVGDVIGPPWLAHVASEEAVVCVERIAGHDPPPIDYNAIPACTYCHPQVASIGLTEQACKEKGIEYKVGKFPLQASGKAQALGETQGFVKLITGAEHDEILGCHMVGENVTELIAEISLARRLEATAEELIATIHAHPTLSESVHEAALGAEGRMIHF